MSGWLFVFSRMYATLHPALLVRPSVRPFVRPSIHHTLLFLGFCVFLPHCSCPNDQVTSNMAPALTHVTGVAMYPALLMKNSLRFAPVNGIWTVMIRPSVTSTWRTSSFTSCSIDLKDLPMISLFWNSPRMPTWMVREIIKHAQHTMTRVRIWKHVYAMGRRGWCNTFRIPY